MPRILTLMILSLVPLLSVAQEQTHVDAAKELLALMHSEQEIEQTYARIMPYMQKMVGSKVEDEDTRLILDRHFVRTMDVLKEELNWAKMEPFMIDAYVSVYTEEELRELSKFYASPIGQKFVTRMPELTEASMRMAMQMLEDFMPRLEELQKELRDELKANTAMKKAQKDAVE